MNEICVVGWGPAGSAVALAFAQASLSVVWCRAARGDAAHARRHLARRLETRTDLSAEDRAAILARIRLATDAAAAISEADLVIEAAPGDVRHTRALLATLESRMSAGAVLATSAPADALGRVADALRRRDQLVSLRFEHPATHAVRAELAWLPETAPGVQAGMRSLCAELGRTTSESANPPVAIGYREWIAAPAA